VFPGWWQLAERPVITSMFTVPSSFATLNNSKELCRMHITSPFVVVPIIIAVFAASILFATSSKEDGHSSH